MFDQETMICCIMVILSVIPLFVLRCCNDDSNKIQRFFYQNDRQMYILLELAIFILTITFIFNIRVVSMFFLYECIEYFQVKQYIINKFPFMNAILK